jgi:maltodextrin utilization protein YvdJ
MPKKTHDELTKEYKAALAKKEAEKVKAEQSKVREKQAALRAKRKMEAKKKELQTELAKKKIAECNAKIEKAEKALESEKLYEAIAKVFLVGFAVMVTIFILLEVLSLWIDFALVIGFVAIILLAISLFFQTKPDFDHKKIRENRIRISKIRQELYAIKNRH